MMRITEAVLRKLIREELIRNINETKSITRKASGEEKRVEEFARQPVEAMNNVRFLCKPLPPKEDKSERPVDPYAKQARTGSPFIATGQPGDAYSKTYNDGKETFRVTVKKTGPRGEEEKRSIEVDAPAIKENDIVVIPELLAQGKMGAGVVTMTDVLDAESYGGPAKATIPIATVKFDGDATTNGIGSSYTKIGWAFLVRLGSYKTDSGKTKMQDANSDFQKALRGDNKPKESSEEVDESTETLKA